MAGSVTKTQPPKKGNWQKSIKANKKKIERTSNKPTKSPKGGRGR